MAFDLSMKVVKNNSAEILGLLEKMETRMNGQEDEIKGLYDQIRVLNESRKLFLIQFWYDKWYVLPSIMMLSNDRTLEKLTKQPAPHSSEFIPDKKIIKLPFEKNELVISPINDTVSVKSESSKSSESVRVDDDRRPELSTNQSILTKDVPIAHSIGIYFYFCRITVRYKTFEVLW